MIFLSKYLKIIFIINPTIEITIIPAAITYASKFLYPAKIKYPKPEVDTSSAATTVAQDFQGQFSYL